MESVHAVIAGLTGVATYALYFQHGERHLYPTRYIQAVLCLFVAVGLGLRYGLPGITTEAAIFGSCQLMSVYLAGIYGSVILYRLFLNPLNKYPGPYLARLTAFDRTFRVARRRDMYKKAYAAHQKLGKFVRVGPNDLSIADADAVKVAFASNSVCSKAAWYTGEHPSYSMQTTRSREEHDRRRRIWSPAFSDKALRGYEERIRVYNQTLINRLSEFKGQSVDISKWFNLWSFDVMGDLAFGRPWGMLESAEEHWAIKLLNEGQDFLGYALPPWFARLLILSIPGIMGSYTRFIRYCADQMKDRMALQGKQANPDITHYLIEDYNARDAATQKAAFPGMNSDSRLIIVAGSDTTATTLTYLFYHLARDPRLLARLRDEVTQLIGPDGVMEHKKLQNSAFLDGCINEALRLHPPVPSGVYRKTPPQGVFVGEEWIPGNTTIQVNLYAMSHSESHFVQPDDFIPERFFSRPELVKHKDAFAPFLIGPYGCIGKNLAYMEIRLLTAYLITNFDVSFAPGEDGTALLSESIDHFTMALAPLHLCFKDRK
ncbi:hypothetical protein FE257_007153 [Aspergillus nanangensis]|uniref:Cytochrome P450 n=1 Tax=Aspergillus nanangensis TaxID=2582783 RepID=A0AAD4GUG8_ASPNN|nr:hypothetical protein FE257_007153 [Aspergillus nanangensis]